MRRISRDFNIASLASKNGAKSEKVAMRIVPLVVRNRIDIWTQVRGKERRTLLKVVDKVSDSSLCHSRIACKYVNSERSIDWDLLLEVDCISIHNTGDIGIKKYSSGAVPVSLRIDDM
jgi:hypothetical protein